MWIHEHRAVSKIEVVGLHRPVRVQVRNALTFIRLQRRNIYERGDLRVSSRDRDYGSVMS